MSDQLITVNKNYEGHEHVAFVQFNRPKSLNAINNELLTQLVDAVEELDRNDETRVIILSGHKRAFAAGADIVAMSETNPVEQLNSERYNLLLRFASLKKPIIAAVSGFALGAGCEVAMACDVIIADDTAKFGQPEIKVGTIPGGGGTQRLTKAIGKSRAMELILTGETFSAKEASDWGLISKVVPKETLLQECMVVARKMAKLSPVMTKLAKQAVLKSYDLSLKDGLDFERHNFYLTFSSEDQKEGMRAFIEKRSPEFKGS
jgi:enoyl-CoA hydratase